MKSFKTKLAKFTDNPLWSYHIKVPLELVEFYKKEKQTRFLVTLNKSLQFHAAINAAGNEYYFIYMNKERSKQLKLREGSPIEVEIEIDTSDYGMPLPQEFAELFDADEEFNELFHALTPGKQRSLFYIVDKIKSLEKRAIKAIVIAEHIKIYKGALDFKILNQAFKEANNR